MLANASRLALVLSAAVLAYRIAHAAPAAQIGVNVVLSKDPGDEVLAELGKHGRVLDVIPGIRGVTLQASASEVDAIRALAFVASAEQDVVQSGGPLDVLPVDALGAIGGNLWNLDAVDVTDHGASKRTVAYDGTGVYVAVVDSGLLDSWRRYFPEERIDTQHAVSFGGGGGQVGTVSTQPNKWQHDQASHGTAVTSVILGFRDDQGRSWNGVAPGATVIPVKVLNQNDEAHASVIARGIAYVADLKSSGVLGASPVVLNLSIGGGPSPFERAAISYALASGVVVVASAGNSRDFMDYPAAYHDVISVGAIGAVGQFAGGGQWWHEGDVPDPTSSRDFYLAPFSGRALLKVDQQLDVLAPGIWIVAPWQENSGKTDIAYVQGTSFAAPHVSGIAALMLQKNPGLRPSAVESILTGSALSLPSGCRSVTDPEAGAIETCWDTSSRYGTVDPTGAGIVSAGLALAATP